VTNKAYCSRTQAGRLYTVYDRRREHDLPLPCASCSLNRMVPPPEPPLLDILSYVPLLCHASRTMVGPKSPSLVISATTSSRSLAKLQRHEKVRGVGGSGKMGRRRRRKGVSKAVSTVGLVPLDPCGVRSRIGVEGHQGFRVLRSEAPRRGCQHNGVADQRKVTRRQKHTHRPSGMVAAVLATVESAVVEGDVVEANDMPRVVWMCACVYGRTCECVFC